MRVELLPLERTSYRDALAVSERNRGGVVAIEAKCFSPIDAAHAVSLLSAITRNGCWAVLLLRKEAAGDEEIRRLFRITSTDLWLWDVEVRDVSRWREILKVWLSSPLHLSAPARAFLRSYDPFPEVGKAFSTAIREIPLPENGYPNPHSIAAKNPRYSAFMESVLESTPRVPFVLPESVDTYRGLEAGHACIVAEASRICPLNCPYCFRKAAYRARPELQKAPSFMFPDVVEAVFSALAERGRATVRFLFHGAEPLLMPAEMVRGIAEVIEKYRNNGAKIDIGVQSGYGVDRERVELFRRALVEGGVEPVTPSASWDPLRGISLSDVVVKSGGRVGCIMVYDGSWKLGEDFKRFARKAAGLLRLQINLLCVTGRPPEEKADLWAETLIELFREGIPVEPAARLMVKAVLGCLVHDCNCERTAKGYLIGVATDGKAGGCDMWTGWRLPEMCWGDVQDFDSLLVSEARVWNTTSTPAACVDCECYPLCGGGCALRRLSFEAEPFTEEWVRSVTAPDAVFTGCAYYRKLINLIVEEIRPLWEKALSPWHIR